LAQVTGALIAFLDADDWWPDDALERLSAPLIADADLDGVIGHVQLMQTVAVAEGSTVLVPAGRPGVITSLCSTLLRRRALERTGPLDESLRYGEDVDWFLRAREVGVRLATIDSVTLFYRRHDRNLTHNRGTGMSGLLTSLRRSLERRRADGGVAEPLPAWPPGHPGPSGMAAPR
jgi:hypothetical protein